MNPSLSPQARATADAYEELRHQSKSQEVPMCTFRRAKVTWPDGRVVKLIVEEDEANIKGCGACDLSEEGFRRRYLVPHDDLGHQELYHGAKVVRGRRLSPQQAAAIRKLRAQKDPEGAPWQTTLPGVLVDFGATLCEAEERSL